jgi:hypothetical protein
MSTILVRFRPFPEEGNIQSPIPRLTPQCNRLYDPVKIRNALQFQCSPPVLRAVMGPMSR